MPYTATWAQPTYEADWPAPPSGLTTLHLIGDPQNNWSEIKDRAPNRVVDQLARDLDSRMLTDIPAAAFQMGDAIGGPDTQTHKELVTDTNLSIEWTKALGYDKVWGVLGNHDTVRDTLGGQAWANLWGLPAPSYTVDLGDVRAIVLGWEDNGYNTYGARHGTPVGPYPHSLVDWLDSELAADSRPTILCNHAHLRGTPTGGDSSQSNYTWWEWNQSTVSPAGVIDVDANYLRDVIDAHPHVIAMAIGHTHSWWWGYGEHPNSAGAPGPHTTLLDLSTGTTTRRSIAVVDSAAVWEAASGTFKNPCASPFVTILDDGRTIETRWRQHDWGLWAGVPGRGRVQRVTAT